MITSTLRFRADLQGLRAIAILLVIFAHAELSIIQGGFIGVDIFFVLSGYLITGLLLRELTQHGRIAFFSFSARRLKRLLPALLAMLSITFMIAIWYLSGAEARSQLASAPFAATWTSNVYFSLTHIDYFDELTGRDLFLHTWSLSVEEQFYLIWPVILLLLFRINNSAKYIFRGLILAFITSLGLSYYWTHHAPQAGFYLMPSRIWQFSLGAMVYVLLQYKNNPQINRYLNNISARLILAIGLSLIISSAILLDPALAYPGLWALIPSLGTMLVIIAGQKSSQYPHNLLSHPILVWLGDRAYGLYLWHWPIFMFGFSIGFQGQLIPTLTMILLSLLMAIISYRLIEYPFWKGRWHHAQTRHIILISLLMMAAMTLAITQQLRQLANANNHTDISNQWRSDVPIIYRLSCDAWYAHAKVEPCVFGQQNALKTVVFVGDSIGAQWFSILPVLFPQPVWRIIVLTKSACAMVDEDYYYERIGKPYQVCTRWRNAVLDELDKLKADVLIMGSASTYDFSPKQWRDGSSRIFQRVSKTAQNVFIIAGTPSLGFDGPGCVTRNLSNEGIVDRAACMDKESMTAINPVTTLLGQASNRFNNITLLDFNYLVCPDGNCNAISKTGLVVFRDSQHLTDSFVQAQIPFIRAQLAQHIKLFQPE